MAHYYSLRHVRLMFSTYMLVTLGGENLCIIVYLFYIYTNTKCIKRDGLASLPPLC